MARATWHPNYQPRDWDLVDYQEFHVRDCDVPFRGPGFDPFEAEQGSFFSCIGAAQTYGCFFPRPFPTLLSESLGMPALNLAVGGAGPGFYTQFDSLIEAMNRGRFVVLQAMAARSESNARYEADGFVEFVRDRRSGEQVTSSEAWKTLVAEDIDGAIERMRESRQSWIDSSLRLIERLSVPVIFFWYSRRGPDYEIDRGAIRDQIAAEAAGKKTSFFVDGLVGEFPQLIDHETMQAVADRCDAYAECRSDLGMGGPLVNRFTGKPFGDSGRRDGPEYDIDYSKNYYYPSPEMHEDAAAALEPVVRQFA
ncbi:hypothetical protein GCM10011371_03300 [Novosphingobium marinum]|uniref:DUF6473 domain-containing protein n=1 Tax=Novosphingobium marinum TaxID=1514948 RepID=A0A7Y9XT56_9SPHN|nr:DUF6473 family protein [Novosphingobium marinum]NYH94022.1 hypothetical protein [Novosphingobium marinum]GGC18996.1 hypothetical protein GCM10011371_03300 [Novosphingobium marinum]